MSKASIAPGARIACADGPAGSPDASAGTPTAATAAHANHGRYLFLSPTRVPLRESVVPDRVTHGSKPPFNERGVEIPKRPGGDRARRPRRARRSARA